MIVISGCPQQVLGTDVSIACIHATWHVAMEDMSNTALQQTHMNTTLLLSINSNCRRHWAVAWSAVWEQLELPL